MQVILCQGQLPPDAAAPEGHHVPLPLILHLKLPGQILGQGFCQLAGMCLVQSVGMVNINNRHGNWLSYPVRGRGV